MLRRLPSIVLVSFVLLGASVMTTGDDRLPAASSPGGALRAAGDLYAVDSIVGNLRHVLSTGPGGYLQGSPVTEACRGVDENQFTSILTHGMAVMETEVTQGMWEALRLLQPTLPAVAFWNVEIPERPAEMLSWYQAVLFANLLSVQQGLTRCYYTDSSRTTPIDATNYTSATIYCDIYADGYRLPTESEWEYFARAGTTGPFSVDEPAYPGADCTGSNKGALPVLETVGWWFVNSGISKPVGLLNPNPWNLKDVHGNLYEYCWDWYGTYPAGTVSDYAGPSTGSEKVIRGGSHMDLANQLRSADRYDEIPNGGLPYIGFRLVRTLPCGDCPTITSAKGRTNKPGSAVVIRGQHFSSNKNEVEVRLGPKKAVVKATSVSRINLTIPKIRKGWYDLWVVINGVKSNTVRFQVK